MTRPSYVARAGARPALFLVAGVLLALLGASPASAHAALERSDPADGAVLDALPSRLTLTFTEAVRAGDDAVEVRDPDGGVLDAAVSTQGNRVLVELVEPTGEATSGSVEVAWQVTSRDGHEISGDLALEVEPPPTSTPTASAAAVPPAGEPSATASAEPVAADASPSPGAVGAVGRGTPVDAALGAAVVVGGLALLVLLAGAVLGQPRLLPLARPAWWVLAGAGLVLLPLLRLRATDRGLGDLTDVAVWLGGLLSWAGLVVVLVVAATGVLSARPRRARDIPTTVTPGRT